MRPRMREIMSAVKPLPKRRASSQERIDRILDATVTLLAQRSLGELSIYAIAAQADIPPSSVYHFFPQLADVLAALAERVFAELDGVLGAAPAGFEPASWMELIERLEDRFQQYYQSHPAARELILGAHELAGVRQADRHHDRLLGQSLRAYLARYYQLPALPEDVDIFALAMQAADKLLAADHQQHGELTAPMRREAKRMMVAYLGLYLPPVLPRASDAADTDPLM
ncbi:transcriptional regulator AguR [Halopseudomonas salina]|uniref:Transcriptional regulator AguR n=2 Tax=Halopseudomonas salina TaxID=1323744 RepID=A0ABQ1P754_9GAMM|nr:transcriptional regulator AguR [Halopseudomonas salina]